MKILVGILCLLSFVGLPLPTEHVSQNEQSPMTGRQGVHPVALIHRGQGVARFGTQRTLLKPGSPVYPGWKLVCDPGSKLFVRYNSHKRGDAVREDTINPGETPYLVPYVPYHPGGTDVVFDTGGLHQSPQNGIFSPPDDGRAWPSHLIFRWAPFPKGTPLKLILHRWPADISDDALVWAKAIVEDGSGTYDSADARTALSRLRDQDPSAKIQFTLAGPENQNSVIIFRLLTEEDEARLQDELRDADKGDALLTPIDRAAAFQRYFLYTEAADEMEQALKASSDNPDLRIATIWADRRAGNLARADYHIKLLPPGTHILRD